MDQTKSAGDGTESMGTKPFNPMQVCFCGRVHLSSQRGRLHAMPFETSGLCWQEHITLAAMWQLCERKRYLSSMECWPTRRIAHGNVICLGRTLRHVHDAGAQVLRNVLALFIFPRTKHLNDEQEFVGFKVLQFEMAFCWIRQGAHARRGWMRHVRDQEWIIRNMAVQFVQTECHVCTAWLGGHRTLMHWT